MKSTIMEDESALLVILHIFCMDGKTDNIQRFKVDKFYHVKKPETTKKSLSSLDKENLLKNDHTVNKHAIEYFKT